MTYEELEALVAQGDPMAVAAALSGLDEAARKKLSVKTGKLYREIDRWRFRYEGSKRITAPLKRLLSVVTGSNVTIDDQSRAATVAALGVCPLTVVKSIDGRVMGRRDQRDRAVDKVLIDRKPDWADGWLNALLDGEWPRIGWSMHRELIAEGVFTKPDSEGYIRFFAQHRGMDAHYGKYDNYRPPSEIFVAEPDLLDDVWRLFEVETTAFLYCWDRTPPPEQPRYFRNRPKNYEDWPDTILNLMRSEHLDRDRLLDATLSGLTTGFKQNVLSGFAKMHEALEPTDAEVAARQAAYLDLLAVPTGQVVSFAVKMLKRLAKAKALDAGAFLAAGSRVFALTTKSQPKAVLSMAKPLMKKHAEHRASGLSLALEGLTHPSDDVQSAALKLLALYPADAPEGAAGRLAELMEDLPATLRGEAGEVLKALGGGEAEGAGDGSGGEDQMGETGAEAPSAGSGGLRERAGVLDESLRARLGVDEAIEALEAGRPTPALSFSVMDAPVLASCEPIVPVETVDELLDAAAHAVEQVDSADEVERLIDGISRLCDQRTADFEARFAPIIKRVVPPKDQRWRGEIVNHFAPCGVPSLVLGWHDGGHREKFRAGGTADVKGFIARRIAEIEGWVRERSPRALLSAPTHSGGWIDARVFVERLAAAQRAGVGWGRFDLIQALLRLAPDGRAAALSAAESLEGAEADAVRWALGGALPAGSAREVFAAGEVEATTPAEPPRAGKLGRLVGKLRGTATDRRTERGGPTIDPADAGLWLAAGRCRDPWGRLDTLDAVGFRIPPPGGIERVTYGFKALVEEKTYYDKTYKYDRLRVEVGPAFSGKTGFALSHCPTVLLHRKGDRWSYFGSEQAWVLRWIESCWPVNNDAVLVGALHGMDSRLDMNSSSFDPNHALLQGLFVADRPWTGVARLAVWMALAGKDADVRGVALDALIEAVGDGRADAGQMGETLLVLSPREHPGWLKLNRLAENLLEVARVSAGHAWFVAGCLERLVDSWEKPPRDGHHVLSLLLEVMTQLGLELGDAARGVLAGVKGSSKTAKLSKGLLSLEAGAVRSTACQSALARQAEARVERAERWSEAR